MNGKIILFFISIANISYASNPIWEKSLSPRNNNVDYSDLIRIAHDFSIKIRAPSIDCPEKIWPNFSWRNKKLQVVLFSNYLKKSMLWNTALSLPVNFNYENIPEYSRGFYGFFNILKDPAIAVNIDTLYKFFPKSPYERKLEFIINVIAHESFHKYWQSAEENWKKHHRSSEILPRGTIYPLRWEPRYFRYLMIENLFNYSLNNTLSLDSGQEAYRLWLNIEPHERLNHTDRTEGAAEYVGKLTTAIAFKGCLADQDEIRYFVTDRNPIDKINISIDSESYALGLFAGLSLDKRNHFNWKMEVKNGYPPHEILWGQTPQNAQIAENLDVKSSIENRISLKHSEVSLRIKPILERINSGTNFFIGVPQTWKSTSYGSDGFYLVNLLPSEFSKLVLLSESQRLYSESGEEIILKTPSPLITLFSIQCNNSSYYVALDARPLIGSDGKISFENELVRVNAKYDFEYSHNGSTFICLK